MNFTLKLSFFVIFVGVFISLITQNAKHVSVSTHVPADVIPMKMSFDFYSNSCPMAENIIRSTFRELYKQDQDIAPALIRMIFHDCFVHGCDASILLENGDGIQSEKDRPQNQFLRKFEIVDFIKSRLEEKCPGVVSCADILALAARESVLVVGGPFYPLKTGRRDSTSAFPNETSNLPSPFDDQSTAISLFASKGFSEKELVILLGAHSTGRVHCAFIDPRLRNFNSTGRPDPSINPEFLKTMSETCNGTNGTAHMRMDYEGVGQNFRTLYYRSLLKGRGLTFLDQQMLSSEDTERFVDGFTSDAYQFQTEFGDAMVKLSNLQVLSAPMGQIRHDCKRVNS